MSTNPTYQDAFAVVAGLERTAGDLLDLAREARESADNVRRAVRTGRPEADALGPLRKQLAWLAGDVERMCAALRRREETPHAR